MLVGKEQILIVFALAIGMRHGVDWDHIAAIFDITSIQDSKREGIFQSVLYAMGHASVVTAIALSALYIGLSFPSNFDKVMERVVGATLLLLGLYVFYSLYRHGDHLRLIPRWAVLYYGILRVFDWAIAKFTGKPVKNRELQLSYGNISSYTIGMIHGIGAETPSQMYMFAMALTAGMKSMEFATAIIVAFAVGLVLMNTLMGILGAYGYVNAGKRVYRYLALFTGVFSIILGSLFILGTEIRDPVTLIYGG